MKGSKVRISCTGADLSEIDDLTEFQGNLKALSKENYHKLRKEIETIGFSEPVSVWKNGGKLYLLNGHQRVRTLKAMAVDGVGIPKIPVNYVEAKDMKEAKRKVLALTSQYGEIEGEGLYEFMSEAGIEWPDVKDSFRFPEIDFKKWEAEFAPEPINEDEVPEVQKVAVTQMGDLWELGNNKLLCGDATNPDHVNQLFNGEKAALFATDPPYLVDYTGADRPGDSGKDWSSQYHEITITDAERFFANALANAIDNVPIYWWHAHKRASMIEKIWSNHQILVHQQIIWVKPSALHGYSFYPWQHEPCFFGWREGYKPNHDGDKSHAITSVWSIGWGDKKKVTDNEHPTEKPVEIFARPMRKHTKVGDLCFEPFSGSGSQIIAAEQLERKCYAIEIEPTFVDVAIERWQNLTGGKAKLIQGENKAHRQATASRKRLEAKGVVI